MARAWKLCSAPGCPEVVPSGRCPAHLAAAEQQRGTAQQRGYGRAHETRFRPAVLRRDPLCVCDDERHGHGPQCLTPSTVADHWPRNRRELVRLGLDPNDPAQGRGLCAPCHSRHTNEADGGGFRHH